MKQLERISKYVVPLLIVLVIALMIALPSFAKPYAVVLLRTVLMFVILTLSWSLFSGTTGYTSLATAAFYGAGLYTAGLLGDKLPLPLLIVCGGVAGFALALLIGAITLRLKGIYFAIFTLSSVELIKQVLHWYEINIAGVRGHYVTRVNDVTVYYVLLAITLLLLVTIYLIKRSKYGLALKSIGSCEEAAAHIGINVVTLKVLTFAVSSFFVGMAGTIMATGMLYIDCYIAFDLNYSFFPTLMAIFGGMGNLLGPLVGAAAFTYLREILITKYPYHYMLIFGTVMVLTILYLPNGLTGLALNIWKKLTTQARQKGLKAEGGKHANTSS
ncbi:MAG TPA: branched-chain amino acid ABC transporter permease [Firmicutes bacterium]|nr:branched-chain amino acid ABC transporter permease [Bacillota bacterium]